MTNSHNTGRVVQGRIIRRHGAAMAPVIWSDPEDAQRTIRGIGNSLLLSLPLWGMSAAILWALL
jgi:hypothetical protein